MPNNPPLTAELKLGGWRDFLELTKPKVSLLIVFTAIVGMVLASPGMVPLPALIFGTMGIGMASGSAAAFNHVVDRRIDEQMTRTRRRPTTRVRSGLCVTRRSVRRRARSSAISVKPLRA